jgi:hypothetical protein
LYRISEAETRKEMIHPQKPIHYPIKSHAMNNSVSSLQKAIRSTWSGTPGEKARRYIGKFYALERIGERISGKVEGNHGTYTVSIQVDGSRVSSTCGCYIGKHGNCHHCDALARTFFQNPAAFVEVISKDKANLSTLNDLPDYMKTTTLETLLSELKAKGITQKAFAESIGMNPRHLGAVKSSELRNHYFNELGAIKLACLWMLDHISKKD